MQTMMVKDGDLVLQGGALGMVTGAPKVQQDLSVALREALGIDKFHPEWGSSLSQYVGSPETDLGSMGIEAEVRRVIANYMNVQLATMQRDYANGHPSRYGLNEVVSSVQEVTVRQVYDTFYVLVTLVLADTSQVSIITTGS